MNDVLRALSWNVRSLRDDREAVVAAVRGVQPDIVCVQEAPRLVRWRTVCANLAADCGLVVVTGGRPAGAMLILARIGVRIESTRDVLLSKQPRLHQRGLAIAIVRVMDRPLGVASMHLDTAEAPRLRHLPEVFAAMDALGCPYVLAGDVNDRPGSRTWAELTDRLADGYAVAPYGGELTSTAQHPSQRIDGVFASPGVEVLRCGVPSDLTGLERASDHLPVLAELRPTVG